MAKTKKPTPEGAVQSAVIAYLKICRLGKVTRNNVGMARMGAAPTHPWAKDTRRFVRFGETGESDLSLELDGDTRTVFIETKEPKWKEPIHPKPGACLSTLKKYRHYLDQVEFQARQIARGHIAFFARSVFEVYAHLTDAGFLGLPRPQETRKMPAAPLPRAKAAKTILRGAI